MDSPIRVGTRRVPMMLPISLTTLIVAGVATAQETPTPAARETLPPEEGLSLNLDVVARLLDIARSEIQPSLGASVFDFSRQAIETQPQGDNQPLNRLLLQAPGVTQDSFGQLHVRNDHANLQFRINGVELPEGINVFGQSLQTRLANSVALIPAAFRRNMGCVLPGSLISRPRQGHSIREAR